MSDKWVDDMIDQAGHVGEQTLRPAWSDSVQVVQRIVNLHCDKMLRDGNMSREAHNEVTEVRKHWTRILQG